MTVFVLLFVDSSWEKGSLMVPHSFIPLESPWTSISFHSDSLLCIFSIAQQQFWKSLWKRTHTLYSFQFPVCPWRHALSLSISFILFQVLLWSILSHREKYSKFLKTIYQMGKQKHEEIGLHGNKVGTSYIYMLASIQIHSSSQSFT